MKVFKSSLIVGLVLVCVGVAIVIAQNRGLFDKWALPNITPETVTSRLPDKTLSQVNIFGSRLNEVSSQTQSLISKNVQVNEEESLPNKTLEYIRYQYCQEVVRAYQAQEAAVAATPAPSAAPAASESATP